MWIKSFFIWRCNVDHIIFYLEIQCGSYRFLYGDLIWIISFFIWRSNVDHIIFLPRDSKWIISFFIGRSFYPEIQYGSYHFSLGDPMLIISFLSDDPLISKNILYQITLWVIFSYYLILSG